MSVVDKFGTDARSISRTLENKDPEQVEKLYLQKTLRVLLKEINSLKIISYFIYYPL